uniref:FLYWCH-type domain-containing protein n=1 Tax=Globodera pallida TaxID=36090 RepID=A0A183CMH2_GLOPA
MIGKEQIGILQKSSRNQKYLTKININLDVEQQQQQHIDDYPHDDNMDMAAVVEPAVVPADQGDHQQQEAERRAIVQFQSGKTQKGGTCLWLEGFRYTKISANYWRCTLRDCPARATILKEEEAAPEGEDVTNGMAGTLGPKAHTHPPEPQKQESEALRHKIKQCVRAEPRLKPARLLAQARRSMPADEAAGVVAAMASSGKALKEMVFLNRKSSGVVV